MENIPQKFMNKDGTLNSDALIKSYTELEKKIGTMVSVPNEQDDDVVKQKFFRAIGVPEKPDEYPHSDLFDDENVKEEFHKIGLTNKQVEKIYDIAQNFLSPVISEIHSMQKEENALTELKKFFGSDEKMRDAFVAIKSFGERFLPADAFETLCATPQGIQGVYKMMQSMEPRIETDGAQVENLSDEKLRDMMRNPKYWRDHDEEYVRKIENGFKKLYS